MHHSSIFFHSLPEYFLVVNIEDVDEDHHDNLYQHDYSDDHDDKEEAPILFFVHGVPEFWVVFLGFLQRKRKLDICGDDDDGVVLC